jgi:hypothetical protein
LSVFVKKTYGLIFNWEYRNPQAKALEEGDVVYSVLGSGRRMLRISKADQETSRARIQEGRIEGAAVDRENLVETIIKKMKELGGIDDLKHVVGDKRVDNARIPLELVGVLGIGAKMKEKTSMTDSPYGIEDAPLLGV